MADVQFLQEIFHAKHAVTWYPRSVVFFLQWFIGTTGSNKWKWQDCTSKFYYLYKSAFFFMYYHNFPYKGYYRNFLFTLRVLRLHIKGLYNFLTRRKEVVILYYNFTFVLHFVLQFLYYNFFTKNCNFNVFDKLNLHT